MVKTKSEIFEDAIREFGINAACEFFDVPKHRWEFFRNELTRSSTPPVEEKDENKRDPWDDLGKNLSETTF